MQETSQSRSILIGALYVVIGTGTAMLASKDVYPLPEKVEMAVFLLTTAAFNLRLYLDRTNSNVPPKGEGKTTLSTSRTISAKGTKNVLHLDDERMTEE